MIIHLSHGRIILSPMELQVRLQPSTAVLSALAEDIQLLQQPRLIIANVGSVSWQLPLETDQQLQQIAEFYGLELISGHQ